jgi:hypothetical protein
VTLEEVEKLIADPPPPGLIDYLGHFRDFVGASRPDARREMFGRMIWSIDYLVDYLSFFQQLPLDMQCPDDVAVALTVLPRIRKMLAPAAEPPGRKRPVNVFKKTAAAIIVTACRRFHWPISRDELHNICQAYWEACGAPEGDAGDWWRHGTEALAGEHHLAERAISAYCGTSGSR